MLRGWRSPVKMINQQALSITMAILGLTVGGAIVASGSLYGLIAMLGTIPTLYKSIVYLTEAKK